MAEYIVDIDSKITVNIGAQSLEMTRGVIQGCRVEEEIIRCRDCKWFRANATPHDPDGRDNFCTQHGFDFKGDNGFCAWAERSE